MENLAIDIHTHVIPDRLPPYAGRHAEHAWPSIEAGECGHRHIIIDGRKFRTFEGTAWDVERRAADMAGMAIGRQVLSPMPELLSYWFASEDGLSFARYMNAFLLEMAASAPERFLAFGMVPLQDPDLAARELEAMKAAGMAGVEIGTNVEERPIGDPRFEPFFAAAEALHMPVFVHALRPAGRGRLVGPPGLEQIVAFPGETGLAAASMITGGMLERHPRLRLAFSHCGGSFGLLLPRLDHIWRINAPLAKAVGRPPLELARTLYYDTLVYDAATLAHLVRLFGDTQLLLGTDYPFAIQERDPVGLVDALGLPPDARERLLAGNARRFLGLEDAKAP